MKLTSTTEKQYNFHNCEVTVQFEPKLIRIIGHEQLLIHLQTNLAEHTLRLVQQIKIDYQLLFGISLNITDESLMIEIWGHLYASKFADILQELIKLKVIENLTEVVKQRSDTIDCGEADVDSNRKFWDVLSKFNDLIIKFL